MRISHKHKFIMISVPKTGSTTFRKYLDDISDVISVGDNTSQFYDHTTAVNLKEYFKTHDIWNWPEYFSFGFVRNPWDWLVSHWFYRIKFVEKYESDKTITPGANQFLCACRHQLSSTGSFKQWCIRYALDEFKPQTEWLYDTGNFKIVDYIGKLEHFQESADYINNRIGQPCIVFEKKNTTKHEKYTHYYDDVTRSLVETRFKIDIENFGYKFGE